MNCNVTCDLGFWLSITVSHGPCSFTAYNYYFHDERQRIQARLFKITGQRPTYTQISKLVGANWRKIKPDTKTRYEALAVKDKRRYALDLLRVKQQEERGEPVDVNEINRGASVGDDSDTSEASNTSGCNNVPSGVDPTSISYQAMLRQSLNANTMNESDFLNTKNPYMLAQMALLSKMMIDYVQKAAPERLANAQLPPGALQGSLSPETSATTHNDEKVPMPQIVLPSGNLPNNSSLGAFPSGKTPNNNWMV